ncbi:MAG TPA: DUF3568 family protein [Candidatus Omnitrophota bacterium]|nr:DUF3568 family protein [Candidatus Omnitrophota bacterium]
MVNSFRNTLTVLLLTLTVMTTSGCFALLLGAAAGAVGTVYVQGDLQKSFERNIKDVHKVVLAVMKSMDILVKSDELNYADASVKGEYEDGEAVTVSIKALTEKTTKVTVRVGVFGDEVKSSELMNKLDRKI